MILKALFSAVLIFLSSFLLLIVESFLSTMITTIMSIKKGIDCDEKYHNIIVRILAILFILNNIIGIIFFSYIIIKI